MIFISSLFTGMSVLVARFAGAGDHDKVDRTVYQAFVTAIGLAVLVMAPIGYFAAPWLLDFVNAAPEVQAEALPFLQRAVELRDGNQRIERVQRRDARLLHAGRRAPLGR